MLESRSSEQPAPSALLCSQDLTATPEAAFALVCDVEKWPVWLACVRTARRADETAALGVGSEIAVRGTVAGGVEELYEVDRFLDGYAVSFVGVYSLRRRFDFRLERKSKRTKLVLRVDYPSYGGAVGALIDRMTARRRLDRELVDSLVHFKGLVEFAGREPDQLLADF